MIDREAMETSRPGGAGTKSGRGGEERFGLVDVNRRADRAEDGERTLDLRVGLRAPPVRAIASAARIRT